MNKKLISILFTVLFLLSFTTSVSAQNVQIEHFSDGSYVITTIKEQNESNISLLSTTKTKTKTTNYYNSDHELLWYVQVKGTFTYGNGSAKCTDAQIFAESYNSHWKISNRSAKKDGNKAIATAKAKFYNGNILIKTLDQTVTLTCSSTGVFS